MNTEHERAYRSVHGLGKITYHYLGMLLGYGDVKPDTWIVRAVQRAADTHQLGLSVTPALARRVVTETHKATSHGGDRHTSGSCDLAQRTNYHRELTMQFGIT